MCNSQFITVVVYRCFTKKKTFFRKYTFFYKQCQAKNQGNAKQHILYTHYHPKIMEHILKNKRKNKCVYSWDYEDENEKRSHWYDINRPRSRHGHKYSEYKKCLNWQCWYVLSNTESTLDPQFIRKLSNTENELKKSVAYKKSM